MSKESGKGQGENFLVCQCFNQMTQETINDKVTRTVGKGRVKTLAADRVLMFANP